MKEVAPVSNDPKADENNNDNNNHNNSNNHNNNNNKKSSPRRTRSMKVAEEDLSFQTLVSLSFFFVGSNASFFVPSPSSDYHKRFLTFLLMI